VESFNVFDEKLIGFLHKDHICHAGVHAFLELLEFTLFVEERLFEVGFVLFEVRMGVALGGFVEIKDVIDSEEHGVEGKQIEGEGFLFLGFSEFSSNFFFLLLVTFFPEFNVSFLVDEVVVFDSAVNIVEGTVAIFDSLIEFAKLPCKVLSFLPGEVL
jgi:hypothetical protein